MSLKQQTLKVPLTFKGKGLHSGLEVTMTLCPADIDHGIVFKRIDLAGEPLIEALAENVTETSRGTTIEKNGARVSTIEHVMAATWSCGIDNLLIEINAPEVPIMDGSAGEYAREIMRAGLVEQAGERKYFEVPEKTTFEIPEKGVLITIYPDDEYSLSVHIDYNSRVLGNQYATFGPNDDFVAQIAPCRTFVFLHELEPLLNRNLIKGGDLDNAIVIVENEVPEAEMKRLEGIFHRKGIEVTSGYLNNLELRFLNEPARHKLLDLLGDLALLGQRIKGKVTATRPGHYANTELTKLLKKNIRQAALRPQTKYNPTVAPIYDVNQIRAILPHRPPFLLVDKIIDITDQRVVGIKNVTMNEPFFMGHFPDEPVMPGVLIVEAMAQCGGILALHGVTDPENYSTYFLKIDGVRFKQKVVPGDTLQFELRLTEPIRRGIVIMESRAFVGDKLASEAQLMAQVIRNKA